MPAQVMSRFDWERTIRDLPSASPLWAHDERCGSGCWRKDGTRLSAATLKHIALTLATYAQGDDGTRIFPGIGRPAHDGADCTREYCDHEPTGLVRATGRHRSTIIAALGHLELAGLIEIKVRANRRGVPRHWATEYMLAMPSAEELARRGIRPPWEKPAPQPEPEPEPQPVAPAGRPRLPWEQPAPDPVPAYDWFSPPDSAPAAMNGGREHRGGVGDVVAGPGSARAGPDP